MFPRARLQKLGRDLAAATLMFAKFSPDVRQVAYAAGNDLYVEELSSGAVRRLTSDGSPILLNGISDWIYEEEFSLRDCFRWSLDGKAIAFWQFDIRDVPDFHMINNTEALYPRIITFKYPKAGEKNATVRIGVVSAMGGSPVWIRIPGDPADAYIPRL